MKKLLFFCVLFLLVLSSLHAVHYLKLDNISLANEDEIVLDPFLVLRTKCTDKEEAWDPSLSWDVFSKIDVFGISAQTYLNHAKSSAVKTPLFEMAVSMEQSEQEMVDRSLVIANSTNVFDHVVPSFTLESKDQEIEKVWWQISADENFSDIVPNLNRVQDFERTISVDLLTDTFFNPNFTYFFRIKAFKDGSWKNWSPTFAFRVEKPQSIQEVSFEKVGDGQFSLSWEPSDSAGTNYLVFASHSLDFIPSIYYDKQIHRMENGEIVEYAPNENFLYQTTEHAIIIDDQYPFYRIIAESRGHTSVPSPIIYVYDSGLSVPRDVLQSSFESIDENGDGIRRIAERVAFPPAYQYIDLPMPLRVLRKMDFFAFVRHPHIEEDVWAKVEPYLLPENHPAKATLDRIFNSQVRVTSTEGSLKTAGFTHTKPRRHSKCVVTRHPLLSDYIVKLFLDKQTGKNDSHQFVRRAYGARTMQEAIDKFNYGHLFKVPQKYIYPLPPEPTPRHHANRKNFIMIAKDMHLVSKAKNIMMWQNDNVMNKERLKALYTLLKDQGFVDLIRNNIPFTRDGRMAFIDTEYNHIFPVPFGKLLYSFGPLGRGTWHELMIKEGAID